MTYLIGIVIGFTYY